MRPQSGKGQLRVKPAERRRAAPKRRQVKPPAQRRKATPQDDGGFNWSPKAKEAFRLIVEEGKKHGFPYFPFGPPILDGQDD